MKTNIITALSSAGYVLDVYLNTEKSIYERFTVPAINRVVKAAQAGEIVRTAPEHLGKDIQEIAPALQAAVNMVRKYDDMQPTAEDIEAVKANYIAYILDCAELQMNYKTREQ